MGEGPFTVTNADGCTYIYLAGPIPPGGAAKQLVANGNIILDFDKDGRLLGIEVLTDKEVHPNTLAVAVPPGTEWPETP